MENFTLNPENQFETDSNFEIDSLKNEIDNQHDQIILEVVQRGYSRDGKVFRPASVVVNDLHSSQEIDDVG